MDQSPDPAPEEAGPERDGPESGAERSAFDADVVVIGSGFGGSVAALRLAEAGQRVLVLERGDWVTRDEFKADPDAFWAPGVHRFGMNELRPRGRHVIPWLGAAVGGGSHVYAATLKRRVTFDGFPNAIVAEDMDKYYAQAEELMDAQYYPDYPPYSDVRATQLFYEAGARLAAARPDLLEEFGPIHLGISFAPPSGGAGESFVNAHGAMQRYSDPTEHSLLGGDIDAKNTLDRNYLHLAQESGARIQSLTEADRIELLPGGGWRVHHTVHVKEPNMLKRRLRKWLPWLAPPQYTKGATTCARLVIAAGAVGSTELLLRNRDVHGTLTGVSDRLGERYTSNGDFISLMLPFRGFFISWAGFLAAVIAAFMGWWWTAAVGSLAYVVGLVVSRPAMDPDVGTTNSDFMRFRHRDGTAQGAYVESGRYPTPVRGTLVLLLSSLGLWRPHRYGGVIRFTTWLRRWVPPFELLARSWPIPLLQMGRDDAVGAFRLDGDGRAVIDYPFEANAGYYQYLNQLGRLVAEAADAWWIPNLPAFLFKKIEVPHNQGGCAMGEDAATGVVDHAGRVFNYEDLMVLDGSIIPVSLGPNPALTILALAERAMVIALEQLGSEGVIRPQSPPVADPSSNG